MESHQPGNTCGREMISIPKGSTWGEHKIHQMEKGAPHGRIGHWQGSTETALVRLGPAKSRNWVETRLGCLTWPYLPDTRQILQKISDGYT